MGFAIGALIIVFSPDNPEWWIVGVCVGACVSGLGLLFKIQSERVRGLNRVKSVKYRDEYKSYKVLMLEMEDDLKWRIIKEVS